MGNVLAVLFTHSRGLASSHTHLRVVLSIYRSDPGAWKRRHTSIFIILRKQQTFRYTSGQSTRAMAGIVPYHHRRPGRRRVRLHAQQCVLSCLSVMGSFAYREALKVSSYAMSLINMFVSAGLVLLHTPVLKYDWDPPFRSYHFATFFFFLSNVFLVLAPLIPPSAGFRPYEWLPYWVSS